MTAGVRTLDTLAPYPSRVWGLDRIRETGCRDSQGCTAVSMTTVQAAGAASVPEVTVSSAAALLSALETAPPGTTIRLEAGNYGMLTLQNVAPGVRLLADRDAPAVLNGMRLSGVDGLELDGIVFDFIDGADRPLHAQPFVITGSENIVIRNALFDGDNAAGTGTSVDGYGTGTGLSISNSAGIALIDSEVTGFMKGVKLSASRDVTFTGNDFHGMRSDAIAMGRIENVLIENNHFHDRRGAPDTNDHADFIQLMSKHADTVSTGLVVRGNLFDIGDGDRLQSLFLSNRAVSNGAGEEMFYRDFVIENNVIIGGQENGIVVGAVDGLVLRNNTVLHAAPLDGSTTSVPLIKVAPESRNVVIADNVTGGMRGIDGQADWLVTGNAIVQNVSPALPDHYSVHFVDPTGHLGGNPGKLMLRPDSPLMEAGVGAAMMMHNETPDTLTPIVQVHGVEGNMAARVFDAGLTAGPGGPAALADARFDWVFSDGVTAQGQQVTRIFSGPGDYDATLTVTMADGQSAVTESTARISGPDIVGFDPKTGQIVVWKAGQDTPLSDVPLADGADQRLLMDLGALDTALALPRALFDPIYTLGRMEIDLQLAAKPGSPADGGILRLHGAFNLEMRDGVLRFSLQDTDGQTTMLQAPGARLGDGFWHEVGLRHDSETGRLELWVDGVLHDAADDVGAMAVVGRDLLVGGPFNRSAFDAWVSDFAVRTDSQGYDFAAVPEVVVHDPLPALQSAPPMAPEPATEPAPEPAHEDTGADVLEDAARDAPAPITATITAYNLHDTALQDAFIDNGGTVAIADISGAVLRAGGGDALLIGGDGDDRLRAGTGDDILFGGAGADQFVFDLRNGKGAGENRVLDLDFSEGDSLRILVDGGQTWLRSADDLDKAVADGTLQASLYDDALKLVFSGGDLTMLFPSQSPLGWDGMV